MMLNPVRRWRNRRAKQTQRFVTVHLELDDNFTQAMRQMQTALREIDSCSRARQRMRQERTAAAAHLADELDNLCAHLDLDPVTTWRDPHTTSCAGCSLCGAAA